MTGPKPSRAIASRLGLTVNGTPPHDTEAERAVLGALLIEPRCFDVVAGMVDVDHFYVTAHQTVYRAIRALQLKHGRFDALLVRQELEDRGDLQGAGGEAYLAQLAGTVPSAGDADLYARRVYLWHAARHIIAAGRELADEATRPENLERLPDLWGEISQVVRESLNGQLAQGRSLDLDDVAPRLIDLLDQPDPDQQWAVERLLEEACGLVLYGPSYVGKSLNGWHLALCLARGHGTVLNREIRCEPRNVVLFYGENSRRQVKNAFRKMLAGEPCPPTLRLVEVHAHNPMPNLATPEGRAWYEAILDQARPSIVLFDTSTSLVVANRNDSETATAVMAWLLSIGKRRGIARIVIHHVRKSSTKGDEGRQADKAYGAHEWISLADSAVLIEPDKGAAGRVVIDPWKIRDSEPETPYVAEIDRQTLTFRKVADLKPAPGGRKKAGPPIEVLKVLRDENREMTAEDLAKVFGCVKTTVTRKLGSADFKAWVEAGIVQKFDGPTYHDPVTYRFIGPMPEEGEIA